MTTETTVEQLRLLPDEPVQITMGEIEIEALAHEEVQEAAPGLVASIKSLGILQPILVHPTFGLRGYPDTDDVKRMHVIDGRRRLDAARKAKLTKVPVAIVTAGEIVADTMTLSANAMRRANLIAETEAIHRLANRGATEREIFQATRMPIQTIRKRLGLLKLQPFLMAALREGKIAPTVAEDIAKLPQESQKALLGSLQMTGRVTAKDVHEVRTARQQMTAAMLPNALFVMDDNPVIGEQLGEPVEAALAQEIQAIINRLPPQIANEQFLVRHSLETAAAILTDIGIGQMFDETDQSPAIDERLWRATPPDDGDPYMDDRTPEQERADHLREIADVADEDRDYGDALNASYTR